MRTREQLWGIPQEERIEVLDTLTEDEVRQIAKGYANTAEAIADYLERD